MLHYYTRERLHEGQACGLSFCLSNQYGRAGIVEAGEVGHGDIMKEYAKKFYSSKAWKNCREAYKASRGGLCERCLAKGLYNPGVIVHHKIYLTPENIGNPNITLQWENLELVCRQCHDEEHEFQKTRDQWQKSHRSREADRIRRWTVNPDGSIAPLGE